MTRQMRTWALSLAALLAMIGIPGRAMAHCDALDGPVVTEARNALAGGDVTPVLKWIARDDEPQVRAAFTKTLAVRDKGPEARELADLWFFETIVRLHRANEGAPYTGLKPAGTNPGPAVRAADAALASGSVDQLARAISAKVEQGIQTRFAQARQAKMHAEHNVEAGRRYVHAYVEFVHYVERLHTQAAGPAHAHAQAQPAAGDGHHHEH